MRKILARTLERIAMWLKARAVRRQVEKWRMD